MIYNAGYFQFGDVSSSDYNVWISGGKTFDAPDRDVEFISVDGRNGDLIQDNKRFNNIEVTYPAFISRTFLTDFDQFRSEMFRQNGYRRLWDSYHPLEYRMAALVSGIRPDTTVANRGGKFDITFNCRPQRYLIDGSEYVTYYPVSNGGFNASGVSIDDAYTYRVEYMPVTPGTTFKASASYADTSIHSEVLTVAFYTNAKAGISITPSASGTDQSVEVTVPSNAAYARVMYGAFMSTTKFTLTVENNGVVTTYSDGGPLLVNPTGYVAQPIISAQNAKLIQVQRLGANNNVSGDVTTVTVSDYSGTGRTDCVIDSVIGDAYSEEIFGMAAAIVNLNPYVTITEDGVLSDYPTFGPGANIINTATNDSGLSNTDCFSSCKIKAGWWHI